MSGGLRVNPLQPGIQNGRHEKSVCISLKKLIIGNIILKKVKYWMQTGCSQDQGPLMSALILATACLQLYKHTYKSVSLLKWANVQETIL